MPRKKGNSVQDEYGGGETCREQSMWGKEPESTCSSALGFQECLGHYRGLGEWALDWRNQKPQLLVGMLIGGRNTLGFICMFSHFVEHVESYHIWE